MKTIALQRIAQRAIILLIKIYQNTFSILIGPSCRFTPSCSSYALLSIQRFGIIRGIGLSIKRVVRCHPFHPGGYDPVPDGN